MKTSSSVATRAAVSGQHRSATLSITAETGRTKTAVSSISYHGSELSMVWVGLGRYFSVFGGLRWVVSTIAKVLKI